MVVESGKRFLSDRQIQQFHEEGYLVYKNMLSGEQVQEILDTFMEMHRNGPIEPYFRPLSAEESGGDILKQYPRVMHPHRFNETARKYMLYPGIMAALGDLLGEEALAAQSMFYYKPPGARGQALHQDNFYLKVEPGTCIAAWVAIDPADQENGGMVVVPKSQNEPIYCPHEADPAVSFTRHEVDVPEGMSAVPVDLEPGDVLFFNGSVIHGSYPNTSKTRFRRSFICHYAGKSVCKISNFYNPLYRADGSVVTVEANPWGGPCGEEVPIPGPH